VSEERLSALENRMYQLHADNARLTESVEHLATAVTSLTDVVQEFRDTLNKGKGAIWLFGVLAAAVGGLISWATTHLFR
jgi:hypothetical protein